MPKWITYTLLTVLLWGLWGVACKAVSDELPAWQLQVISLLGVLPVIAVLGGMVGKPTAPTNYRMLGLSFAAGLLGCVGNLACFEAMSAGGKAAAVIPLTSLYPITTIILALALLKERPTLVQSVGIGLSLLAIWLFNVADGSHVLSPWLVYCLLPIVCWGVGGFIQKLATNYITGHQCALAFLVGFLPIALVTFFEEADWSAISNSTWGLAAASGLLFALGNLTVTLAYESGGRAVIVTPAAGLYMLVTVPLAVGLLHETITWREGEAIVVSVLAVLALCQEASPAKKAATLTPILALICDWRLV
jgi:transporter family protein